MSGLPLRLSGEVAEARSQGRPVVALESSLIAHGLPCPHNVETALTAEECVRSYGAVPATAAVLEGRIAVGLTRSEIEALAAAKGIPKVGRAELPAILAAGGNGATTVSSTMAIASLAGIQVFATGGIGGVHRHVTQTFDISQDLLEFSRSSVLVVASGAKAILDIPKTLEMLETLGVPLAAYGQDEFPAFWARSSGIRAPARFDDPAQFAAAFSMQRRLGLKGGFLAANPIPANAEISLSRLQPWIEDALAAAAERNLTGKEVTPFLLNAVARRSQGDTIQANKALIRCNVELAARIAVRLANVNDAGDVPQSAGRTKGHGSG